MGVPGANLLVAESAADAESLPANVKPASASDPCFSNARRWMELRMVKSLMNNIKRPKSYIKNAFGLYPFFFDGPAACPVVEKQGPFI